VGGATSSAPLLAEVSTARRLGAPEYGRVAATGATTRDAGPSVACLGVALVVGMGTRVV
jgi:hypothetical protein